MPRRRGTRRDAGSYPPYKKPIEKYSPPTYGEAQRERIARSTLKMADPILGVMGGMTKAEAREILGRPPKCFSIAYDNLGRSFDQYTVFFRGESGGDGWDECWVRGMSDNPQHPQGFNQYIGDCEEFPDTYTPDAAITLGEVRDWDELPRKVQKAIANECSEVGY